MFNRKTMIIHLIAALMKMTLHKMSQYFRKPYEPLEKTTYVKVDFSNYVSKTDLKKVVEIVTLS